MKTFVIVCVAICAVVLWRSWTVTSNLGEALKPGPNLFQGAGFPTKHLKCEYCSGFLSSQAALKQHVNARICRVATTDPYTASDSWSVDHGHANHGQANPWTGEASWTGDVAWTGDVSWTGDGSWTGGEQFVGCEAEQGAESDTAASSVDEQGESGSVDEQSESGCSAAFVPSTLGKHCVDANPMAGTLRFATANITAMSTQFDAVLALPASIVALQ